MYQAPMEREWLTSQCNSWEEVAGNKDIRFLKSLFVGVWNQNKAQVRSFLIDFSDDTMKTVPQTQLHGLLRHSQQSQNYHSHLKTPHLMIPL